MKARRALPIILIALAGFDPASAYAQTTDMRDRNLYEPDKDSLFSSGRKVVVNSLLDQKPIWTSPFHTNKQNARWWLILGAGTAALIASDHRISEQLPNTGASVRTGNDLSRVGAYYSVYPFAASLFLAGNKLHDRKLSQTGLLTTQALIDSAILANVLKIVVRRERPLSDDEGGHFEKGGASFPSGHSIQAWTVAAVVARQYRNRKWVPFAAYAYAASVSIARVSARQHFPSDVLVGSALGFFIGRYVANNHDRREDQLKGRSTRLAPSVEPTVSPASAGVELSWDLTNRSRD